jgi:hypothetical protein
MHLPLLNAFDPYALSLRARRDRAKEAFSEPFVIASALEKPRYGRRNASDAYPDDGDAPEDETISTSEDILAAIGAIDSADGEVEEAMPEDAIDGLGLCALLEAAASG